MKCIDNIFYLIFSTESNEKNMCILSYECPFNSVTDRLYSRYCADMDVK